MTQNNTQDLRERAASIFHSYAKNGMYRYDPNEYIVSHRTLFKCTINAMLQFASEVAAEKHKEVSELKAQVNALKQNCKARIAELGEINKKLESDGNAIIDSLEKYIEELEQKVKSKK